MDVFSVIFNVIIILLVCCLAALYWFLKRRYNYWEKRGVPCPKPLPLIGNLSFLMRRSASDFFLELYKDYPDDVVGVYFGLKPVLVIQSPELARKVLVQDGAYFRDRYLYTGYSSDPLGSLNLFSVKEPIWSSVRHELSPLFTSSRLRMVCQLMSQNASALVGKVQRDYVHSDKPLNVKELFLMYTSDTVAYSVFGIRQSVLNDQPSPLWAITNHMVQWTFRRGLEFSAIFFIPDLAKLLRLQFFSAAATEYIRKMFHSVVEERKATRTDNDKDLVNHLLKLKDNMKLPSGSDPAFADNVMMAQVAVFILGSIETSSTTLYYCLHELAYHPDVQEKLYNEINDALTRKEKDILEYDDLLELKYMNACIYETLRKYPPLPHLDRLCGQDYQLTESITVERGTPVYINVAAIHHNETVYPNPEEWQPGRNLPTSDGDHLQFSFLPFGEGPRFCIGKRYGLIQVRAALAQLIHRFALRPAAPYQVRSDPNSVILAPADSTGVKFLPRTNN